MIPGTVRKGGNLPRRIDEGVFEEGVCGTAGSEAHRDNAGFQVPCPHRAVHVVAASGIDPAEAIRHG